MKLARILACPIFLAVLLHKIPEGLTIASVMLAADHRRKTAFLASAAVAVATVLGVLGAILVAGMDERMVGYAFAFSAGAATYVGASDLIPEINHSRNRIIPVLVFVGMLLLYAGSEILALLVPAAH